MKYRGGRGGLECRALVSCICSLFPLFLFPFLLSFSFPSSVWARGCSAVSASMCMLVHCFNQRSSLVHRVFSDAERTAFFQMVYDQVRGGHLLVDF